MTQMRMTHPHSAKPIVILISLCWLVGTTEILNISVDNCDVDVAGNCAGGPID
jgi:hypothetical protein